MSPDDLQQIREVVREEIREQVPLLVRDELKPIHERLDRLERLLIATARSLRDLLARMESPIIDDIREGLDRAFEREGVSYR